MMPSENSAETSIKKVCVTKRGNKLYYPKSLPKIRGVQARWFMFFILVFLFLVNVLCSKNAVLVEIGVHCMSIWIVYIYEIIIRCCLFTEEMKHLKSRYEDGKDPNSSKYSSLWKAFKDTFWLTQNTFICLVITALYLVYFVSNNFSDYEYQGWRLIFCIIPVTYIGCYLLEMNSCPLSDAYWISKDNGLDYGSGMAYSFFYGYLKLVVEKTGDSEKNLKELIEVYEDVNGIKFAAYKLFILLPKSMVCFVSLGDCLPHSSIEHRKSLDEKFKTVAGVKNRVYKNSVYTITNNKGRKVYVCAEYATPLKTFRDVTNSNGNHAKYYRKYKNEILSQFYLTLKSVLEEQDLDQFCELIYYDDKDDNGKYHDVGEIILNRLKELEKENKRQKAD